ncbi:unnamed protein product [Urochloa decumbens]|uniref:Uncharacterized protein n=1 Tax=Urochloa decumbens TaxID=240449 RepID=A0ABC8Z3M2_9POAL
MVLGGSAWWRRQEAAAIAALKLREALPAAVDSGVAGLATASAAITLAVCKRPPAGIHPDTYFLAVSGCFFIGVAQLGAAVWASIRRRRRRHAAGMKKLLVYASLCPLAAAVGLSVASLLW